MTSEPRRWLDERGELCPQPIIALARACVSAPPGTIIGLLSDDPAAQFDVPAWCRLKGMEFIDAAPAPDGAGGTAYRVRVPG